MHYKMVALDLDGTLLDDSKRISRYSMEVLRALRAINKEIVIATGRRYRYAKALFANWGFPVTILSSGGACARNTGDDRKITSRCLETELFLDRIMEKHGDRLHCHLLTTLKRIGPVLEIMNPLGAKWRALADYAGSLGILPGEIVALGDDNNDVEIIKNSGLGIAMKNATGSVKAVAVAGAVTLYSNNEDGAAKALAGVFGLHI